MGGKYYFALPYFTKNLYEVSFSLYHNSIFYFWSAKNQFTDPYDSIFIDKTEISNIHWLEYLHYLRQDSVEVTYMKAIPDSLVWDKWDTTGIMKKHYLSYPGYRQFPVVGITFEQANDYCEWRSKAVNNQFPDSMEFEYIFRLPTEKEWCVAAKGSLNQDKFPYGYELIYRKPQLSKDPKLYYKEFTNQDSTTLTYKEFKKMFRDYLKKGNEPIFNTVKDFPNGSFYYQPLDIFSSLPNKIGVYNMIGNVAEMVAVKGIAKGGSWAHDLEGSKISTRQLYSKPDAWLGFRCVCEVKSSK
ncbi:MAG: formylglycine-generating enzyme family protein [Flammeovirgaceae bacterium]|nr:formylglycine-generating enzyme family protein [Flammeovirgaceae bacterium]